MTALDASNGVLVVLTVGAGGVVETLGTTAGNQGTGYSIAAGLSTTTNSVLGSGLEVDITAIGETLLEAVEVLQPAQSTVVSVRVLRRG